MATSTKEIMQRFVLTLLPFVFWSTLVLAEDPPIRWGEAHWGTLEWTDVNSLLIGRWIVGVGVSRPDFAEPESSPDLGVYEDYFHWDVDVQKLYPIRPSSNEVTVRWLVAGETDLYRSQVRLIDYPAASEIITHLQGLPPVDLLPEGSPYTDVDIVYSETQHMIVDNMFTEGGVGGQTGYTVLMYDPNNTLDEPVFDIIHNQVVNWAIPFTLPGQVTFLPTPMDIGTIITSSEHNSQHCKSGYVYNAFAPYMPNTEGEAPYDGYHAATREGPIVLANLDSNPDPVNDLLVAWYRYSEDSQVCWPHTANRYEPQWPSEPEQIVIASGLGSGVLPSSTYMNPKEYEQPDESLPGFNPNEEHADVLTTEDGGGSALFALRNDLNDSDSEPYSILKYQTPAGLWNFKVYQVVATNEEYDFTYELSEVPYSEQLTAGNVIEPPYPLNRRIEGSEEPEEPEGSGGPGGSGGTDIPCKQTESNPGSAGVSGPYWEDHQGQFWAKAAGDDGSPTNIEFQFYEEWRGTCTPWLDAGTGTPQTITYEVRWPDDVDEMRVGQTLTSAATGLTSVIDQCSVEVLYQQSMALESKPSVQLLDFRSEHFVDLNSIPAGIKTERLDINGNGAAELVFKDLPYDIKQRLYYDELNQRLILQGVYDNTLSGNPIVLLNILSERDRSELLAIGLPAAEVNELFNKSREQLSTPSTFLSVQNHHALSAGVAEGTGYVSIATQSVCDESVQVSVFQVTPSLYAGDAKALYAPNVFEEQVTLRHSGDFGGTPEEQTFEWRYWPNDGNEPADYSDWISFHSDEVNRVGAVQIVVRGSGAQLIEDKTFAVRYTGYDETLNSGTPVWSQWVEVDYRGWLGRISDTIDGFAQLNDNYHETEVDTVASAIAQAGPKYEGDIALNANGNGVNDIRLIPLYQTVLNRGRFLSIEAVPPVNTPAANNALLRAAGRLSDHYMLLGNEAYADALDPTIGYSSGAEYDSEISSMFTFQNQVPSLLEEELALLRGRDDTFDSVQVSPTYNRLSWNLTAGIGAIAYKVNYNLTGKSDLEIREQYPQAHGDAWGHYLTAIKVYYGLLQHPNFTWTTQSESVDVNGTGVTVSFLHERNFAQTAAARARTGLEIMNLTYRQKYTEDPAGQWQGYQDTNSDRAWGVADWASRAGQAAYFDWVTANALLPDEDTKNVGIEKVDRTTVMELDEVASYYEEIESQLDKADNGLNPLGLVTDVIPFDINPNELAAGKTHFEQTYENAVEILLNNTLLIFNEANQETRRLRLLQDNLNTFQDTVEQREADFTNRLVEVFGYPYPEDIGSGGAYPVGYNGPDIYHYDYVDVVNLIGNNPISGRDISVNFTDFNRDGRGVPEVDGNGNLSKSTTTRTFHISTDFGRIKPASWTGTRQAQGQVQMARINILQAQSRFQQALVRYDNLLRQIEAQAQQIDEQRDYFNQLDENLKQDWITKVGRFEAETNVLRQELSELQSRELSLDISDSRSILSNMNRQGSSLKDAFRDVAGAVDLTGVIEAVDNSLVGITGALSQMAQISAESLLQAKAQQEAALASQIEIRAINRPDPNNPPTHPRGLLIYQMEQQLTRLVREKAPLEYEIQILAETMSQAVESYLSALATGKRLLQEQVRFRQKTALAVQDYRYRDMAFRIFRNNALQKYRSQFDLASMYVYLAAKAYDFDTSLLPPDAESGSDFFTDIIRQRTIGKFVGAEPVSGNGLAGVLKALKDSFNSLKDDLNLNNPDIGSNEFSLREELFRIKGTASSVPDWSALLRSFVVQDLWNDVPEFRQFADPFSNDGSPQPAIVIPFSTTVTEGLNYFGEFLGGGDSNYPSTRYSHKIESVSVEFINYDLSTLSATPHIYLIPVGADILRIPQTTDQIRMWRIFDQVLPDPRTINITSNPLDNDDFDNYFWLPSVNGLEGNFAERNKISNFRAYYDLGGSVTPIFSTRLVGRSVWNTQWLLIIPGLTLNGDPQEGIDTFIDGKVLRDGEGNPILDSNGDPSRDFPGVTNIELFIKSYSYD